MTKRGRALNTEHRKTNAEYLAAGSFIHCSVFIVWRSKFALFLLGALLINSVAQAIPADALAQISFEQKLNAQVTLDLPFTDENGNTVTLRRYFGGKPAILLLGYYGCPMLCTLTLNGMVATLQDMKWTAGNEFQIIYVSIDPQETPALGLAKKRNYLKRYGRPGEADGWHFLTGTEPAIRQLAGDVGFQYAYDPDSKQYAHPSGLVILTPEGKVSRYLFGVTYEAKELYTSLQNASQQKIGSPIQRLILLCFHYNPITGKYGATIMLAVRFMALATILGLAWMIFQLTTKNNPAATTNANPESAAQASSGTANQSARHETS